MVDFLSEFRLLKDAQHGFRAGRSAQTTALSFVDHVFKCLDDGLWVSGLFFDLSRAFDCLNFKFIRDKMFSIGFRGVFLQWVHRFLTDRLIYIKLAGYNSDLFNIELGVPQGSVLGPLIFSLFINDMPEHVFAEWIIMFADDTSFAISAKTRDDLI